MAMALAFPMAMALALAMTLAIAMALAMNMVLAIAMAMAMSLAMALAMAMVGLALALEYVLLLDELMFEALAPWRVHDFMGNLEPVPLPSTCNLKGLDVFVIILLLEVIAVVSVCLPLWLWDEVQSLKDARQALCDGKTDFAFSRTNYPPYLVWGDSISYGSGARQEFFHKVVESIAEHGTTNVNTAMRMNQLYGVTYSVETLGSLPTSEAMYTINPACDNILTGNTSLAGVQSLQEFASFWYGRPVTTCSDVYFLNCMEGIILNPSGIVLVFMRLIALVVGVGLLD